MTTLLHPQPLTLVAPHAHRTWTRLLHRLEHLAGAGTVRAHRRHATFSLVVDGLVDEAWLYADALVDATEEDRAGIRAWWQTHGSGLLELRCEVWGSGRHLHVTRTADGVRCLLQRAPETTWAGGDPAARARADVQEIVAAVAATLQLPPPEPRPD